MNRSLAPEIKLIDSIALPDVKKITLDNGVPVYLLNAGEQDVIKIELMFKAGKWYEQKNLVADFTNRMLREGTTTHDAKHLADKFDYYGANFNTSAGFETAGSTLYCLTKHIEQLLPLYFEIFSESIFPQSELDTIISNRKQKLKVNLEKNDFLANRNFVSALYGKSHPYGRVTEFEQFDAISSSDLKAHYQNYYNGSNLTIIVSGRFEDSIADSLNRYFGSTAWKGQRMVENIIHPEEPSTQLVHHTDKPESVQSAIIVGNLSINKSHPDFMKLSILNTVFGGYFGSRLMSNIREEKGYTYGIYSSFVSYPHGGFIEIASEVGKEVRDATLSEIEYEINALRSKPVEPDELQVVKNYMSGKVLRSVDGPMKFSETLKGLLIYNQELSYIQEFLNTIREVTAEELQDLAVRYLDYSKMYKVTVG